MTARLYSHLKFTAFPDRIAALRTGKIVPPVHIRIKPINRCNHDCWYCAYRASHLQLGSEMKESDVLPEAKMFEIADDLVEMGVKAVTFSGGGEPLLYKPLPDVIDRLALGGIKVAALTNGSNLQGRMAEAFARHATWVRVSIDAWDDESYARQRGVKPGEFSRVISNMQDFTARKSSCVLGVSFIIDKNNHTHIHDMCQKLKSIGVGHVSLSGVVVDNTGNANNDYHRSFREAAQEQIALARRDLADDSFSIIGHYHELDDRFDKAYTRCPFLQFQTVIGADACVYACHDKAYNAQGLLGSIAARRFKEFWHSEENRLRMAAINPSRDCRHHCVAHQRNLLLNEILALDADHLSFV